MTSCNTRRRAGTADNKEESTTATNASARLSSGLPFGSNRRVLPWDVESLCYSFLGLDTMSALLIVSHALQSPVVRRFKSLKTLSIEMQHVCGDATEQRRALSFARKHCASLVHITANNAGWWSSEESAMQFDLFIRPIIRNNRTTLVSVSGHVPLSEATLSLLTQCAQLETFDFRRDSDPAAREPMRVSDALCHSINTTTLPRLRALLLTTHVFVDMTTHSGFADVVTPAQVVQILRNDFPLTSLGLTVSRSSLLVVLSAARFTTLTMLQLDIEPTDAATKPFREWVKMLNALGRTLAKMNSLANLDLGIGYCPKSQLPAQTLFKSVHWHLPALTTLRFDLTVLSRARGWGVEDVPCVSAPSLTALKAHGDMSLLAPAVETCMQTKHLQSLSLDLFRMAPDAPAAMAKLVHGLRADVRLWPALTELHIESGVVDGLLPAIAQMSPGLKRVFFDQQYYPAFFHDLCNGLARHHATLIRWCVHVDSVFDANPDIVKIMAAEAKRWVSVPATITSPLEFPELTLLSLSVASDRIFRCFRFPVLSDLFPFGHYVHLSSLDVLLNACPALRYLELTPNESKVGNWLPSKPYPALTTLSLLHGFDESFEADPTLLVKLLAAFPQLEHLTLVHDSLEPVLQCAEHGYLQQLRHFRLSSQKTVIEMETAKQLIASLPRLVVFDTPAKMHGPVKRFVYSQLQKRL